MVPNSLKHPPTVHVGIVTYNNVTDLPRCFESLRAQTYPAINVLALDNASFDGSDEWIRDNVPGVILCDQNWGFAGGHNRIVQACGLRPGEYYLPLNPDVVLQPGYIAALVHIAQEQGAGWATGKLLLPREPGQAGLRLIYSVGHALRRDGYAFNIGHGLVDDGQFDSPREVFGAPGAAVLISQALIESIAPDGELFDAAMFMYGEDTDLDWRARRQGWHCWYTPLSVADHRGSHPGAKRRLQATGNRYLSVIKNAYLVDLFGYNLGVIGAHCLARLVVTPRLGLRMIRQLAQLTPKMWRKRRRPVVGRGEMRVWFRWSQAQVTGQPTSIQGRLSSAAQHRG
jgi:GT2 family glycosyltransferase